MTQDTETVEVNEPIADNLAESNRKSTIGGANSISPTNYGLKSETAPSGLGMMNGLDEHGGQPEALNKKALSVINRVRDKLTGRDFNPNERLAVPQQVDLLIKQATSKENLCQCYIGWCPFW